MSIMMITVSREEEYQEEDERKVPKEKNDEQNDDIDVGHVAEWLKYSLSDYKTQVQNLTIADLSGR